nr:amidohydrolase [Pseudomarimonas arenosa]
MCAIGYASHAVSDAKREPWASSYQPPASLPVLIRGADLLTGTGERLEDHDVLVREGKIAAIGQDLEFDGAEVVEAKGRILTPGLIDVHSHLGVYPSPEVEAHQDGNELSDPVTAGVWAEHAVWPQDPGFETALAGGVTTLQILPGSANLIGGRGVTLKNVPATSYQAMKFPAAPQGLKMACGENPKRFYGSKGQAPTTRMGNLAGYRQAFADAVAYRQEWDSYASKQAAFDGRKDKKKEDPPTPPKRDLRLDTLVAAMKGEVKVHVHCYRSDEMVNMLDLSREFGFKISTFHHGVEFYKLSEQLAEEGICGALWADWWGFKMEAYDGIQENIALADRPANSCAVVHSDSEEGIQRLNQEAAKAMASGQRAGLHIAPERAIRWITANPAKSLGIDDRTGSIEVGKMADLVLWNGNPFSVTGKADLIWIDGALAFDRQRGDLAPRSDFLLGQPTREVLQ